jgi:DNA invertase Pin-like site-specific DNA recombinase
MSRPGFIAMTEAVERGEHDTIVSWDISRISRGFNAQPIMWLERLDTLDIRLVLLEVGVDTSTAWGRFFMRFQWLQGCLFSDLKGEEWKRVHRRRKEKGLPTGGELRWGPTEERDQFIIQTHAENPEMGYRDIAIEVGRRFNKKPPSTSTISRVLNKARDGGESTHSGSEPAGTTG